MKIQIGNSLKKIIDKHQITQSPILFDFKEASNKYLLLETNRSNRNFHYIHNYPGRIYPYIPLYILALDDFSQHKGKLLDPFTGSGTILLESLINPVRKRNAYGVEINPIARLVSKVKITPLDLSVINPLLDKIHDTMNMYDEHDLLSPKYDNINLWFSSEAIKKLSKLKYGIQTLESSKDTKDFFWVCFSHVIRKVSRANPLIPPPVILKPEKYIHNASQYVKLSELLKGNNNPDVWGIFQNIVKGNAAKLTCLNHFKEFSNREVKGRIIWDDSRSIKNGKFIENGRIDKTNARKLSSKSIDIIFTSPPYLTAQKYIRTTKLELLWMGFSPEEIITLDKLSIGTESVSMNSEITEFGLKQIDTIINRTKLKSKERAITIQDYFINIRQSLQEMHRVLIDDGYAILVLGDNTVLGKKIHTYKLLNLIASSVGFTKVVILKDKIKTRSMMTKRNGSGGLIKTEYIIILHKEG